MIEVGLLLPADIPEIVRFFPARTFSPLVGEVIFTLCALGCYVRERDEGDLLLLIGTEAWLFGNTCPNPRLVEMVDVRSKRIIAPTINWSELDKNHLIPYRMMTIIEGATMCSWSSIKEELILAV